MLNFVRPLEFPPFWFSRELLVVVSSKKVRKHFFGSSPRGSECGGPKGHKYPEWDIQDILVIVEHKVPYYLDCEGNNGVQESPTKIGQQKS